MLKNIQKVLRVLMLLVRPGRVRHQKRSMKGGGGLLVLLWAAPGRSPTGQLNCTVAAAGPWCSGVTVEQVQQEFWQRLAPLATPCPTPDPEELCAFTEVYGPLHFLLSLQVSERRPVTPLERSRTENLLQRLSLTNAGINIHFKLKSDGEMYQQLFKGKTESKVSLKDQTVVMDVACHIQCPVSVATGLWCRQGHPVLGGGLPLRIPPEAMETGLYGELSLLPVTVLTPCVRQYPNMATRLTRIQVLLYSPINLPLLGPSAFLQQLPASLACEELGLHGLTCAPTHTTTEPLCSGIVYTIDGTDCQETEPEWSSVVQQTLSLFLFLRHSDPFHSQLSDFMASEELLEHHLEDVLRYNKEAVTGALHTLLQNKLKDQQKRHKVLEKIRSAQGVILSCVSCVVNSSTNMEFRSACLDSVMVQDTHELSASLQQSLKTVTVGRCVSRTTCSSGETDTHASNSRPPRNEI